MNHLRLHDTKSISTGRELRTGIISQNTGNDLTFLARFRKSSHTLYCGRTQDLTRATLCMWQRVVLTSTHTHVLIRAQIHTVAKYLYWQPKCDWLLFIGCEILRHPNYNTHLAPDDYMSFHPLRNNFLASDLQQTLKWSKLPHSRYGHLTPISSTRVQTSHGDMVGEILHCLSGENARSLVCTICYTSSTNTWKSG